MKKGRLEALSDGVIAIIIIMVLEFKVPHGDRWEDLLPLCPVFLSYVLSFVNVGIYWNNHHHLLHATDRVNAPILWANMNFLFWLSLMPFTTAWMGENHFGAIPVALYAVDLTLCGFGYIILQSRIVKSQGADSVVLQAVGDDLKGKVSMGSYLVSIPLALLGLPWLAGLLLASVALIWLIPDRRIEKKLSAS